MRNKIEKIMVIFVLTTALIGATDDGYRALYGEEAYAAQQFQSEAVVQDMAFDCCTRNIKEAV